MTSPNCIEPLPPEFREQNMSERQLSLNLFIYPNGHHEAAWRHPQSVPESSMDIGYYQQLALRAEREKLDAIFFADSPSLAESGREGLRIRFEPVTWLAVAADLNSPG